MTTDRTRPGLAAFGQPRRADSYVHTRGDISPGRPTGDRHEPTSDDVERRYDEEAYAAEFDRELGMELEDRPGQARAGR
jgi:hypothetical protein